MKRRIYISGAVSGIAREEAEARFAAAAEELAARGYEVVNPLEVIVWEVRDVIGLGEAKMLRIVNRATHATVMEDEEAFWRRCMVRCFRELLLCDAIYMLSNWRESRGARVELAAAVELGLETIIQGIRN
jgi:hypothetical protein